MITAQDSKPDKYKVKYLGILRDLRLRIAIYQNLNRSFQVNIDSVKYSFVTQLYKDSVWTFTTTERVSHKSIYI